jgi:hypothetical protein
MDEFMLKQFFHEMLTLSYNDLRAGWGNPCSHLLEDVAIRQKPFLNKIMGDYSGDSHEYRLNDAGLKMHWEMRKVNTYAGEERMFKCHVSGDQAKEYPMFVAQVNGLILKYQFNKHPRFPNLRRMRLDSDQRLGGGK